MFRIRGHEREHEDPDRDRDKDDDVLPRIAKVGSRSLTSGLHQAPPADESWLVGHELGGVGRARITPATNTSRLGDLTRLRATLEKLVGGGAPLPATTSSKYSALLGADLSSVRIHASGEASEVTAAMGARAFTHGAHIAFAPGAYDEATADHDHVLAHELVHVVQNQRSGGPAMQLAARLDVGPSGSAVESEAEAGAHALTAGQPFAVASRRNLPGISLFDGPGPAVNKPETGAPPATTGAPPATTGAPPAATTGAPPATTGAPPATTGAPPAATTGAPPAATTGAPPAATTGAPPAVTGAPPASTVTPGPVAPAGPTAPAPVAVGAAIDSRVAAILEQRADPGAKSSYNATLGSIMTLRLTATQYSFVNSNIGHTLWQMVWPSDALGDHVGQVGKLNAYRGGDNADGSTSFWGGIQKGIESLRGVLHMLGDLAAALSAIAGAVAIGAAAVGAFCAISIIGLAGPAEVAAGIAVIADAIATAAALVKIAADLIDMFLGFLQICILVARARAARGDPAARARFAQLLHKEAGDFAGNLVGVVVQVGVLLATAGAGAGGSKGLMKMTAKDVGHEFEKLLPTEALKSLKSDLPAGLKLIKRGLADTKAGTKMGPAAMVRGASLGADEEIAKLSVILRNAKGKALKVKGGGKAREMVEFTLDKQRRGTILILNTGKVNYIGIKNIGAIGSAALTTQFLVDTKAPSGPGGPGGEGPKMRAPGTPVAGSLATVQMWPGQVEAFKTEKNLLGNVKEHVEEQYENAKTQAGPDLAAAFEVKIKAAIDKRNAAKEEAASVKGDAASSKDDSTKGATAAGQGADTKKKADDNNTKIKDKTDTAGGKADTLKTPPAKDGVGSWLYNHSLGYLGQAIGWIQSGIKNNLGKFLFYMSGYSSTELDMAGIEGDMRTATQNDTHAGETADQTSTAVDPVQQAVVEMQQDKTTSQQQAIQGMADAKNFIEALEEADKTLGDAIETGGAYMAAAAPLLQHELDTETQGKPIDGAYVQPILAYADAVASSIDAENEAPTIAAAANAKFTQLAADLPGIDIGPAQTVIAKASADYQTGHTALVANAHTAADKVKAAASAFIGTTDFDGCNQNAAALDHLADDMSHASDALGDTMVKTINDLIDQYNLAIAQAMAGQTQPGPVQSVVPPGVVTPNTPPAAPTGGDHRVGGSHERLAGDFTPAPAAGVTAPSAAPPAAAGAGVSITSATTAQAAAGAADRTTVGIGEDVTFTSGSGESGTWTASGGTPANGTGSSFVWSAPGKAGQFSIKLKVGDKEATKGVAVILPQPVVFTKASEFGPAQPWMIGTGMKLDMDIEPYNVSFANMTILEQPGGASGLSGYFASGNKGDLGHHPSTTPTTVNDENTTNARDEAKLMDAPNDLWPRPLAVGSMTWSIPYLYSAAEVANQPFQIVTQVMSIVDSRGTVTITKGGQASTRSPTGKPPADAITTGGHGSLGGELGTKEVDPSDPAPAMKNDSARFEGDKALNDVGAGGSTIASGANGLQVTKIQQALIDLGYLLPKYGVDGKFKDETKAALVKFQTDHSIAPPSGQVDAATMKALNTAYDTRKPYVDNAKVDPLNPGTRALSADDKKAAIDALVPPKGAAGAPAVFTDDVGGNKYGDEIDARLTAEVGRLHKKLFDDKVDLRKDPAKNFHSWTTLEGPALAAKQVVDALYDSNYGGSGTYPPMTAAGGNLVDQWTDEENTNKGLTDKQKLAKATEKVWYLINSNCSKVNTDHGAVPSAATEKGILTPIVTSFVDSDAKVQTMLELDIGWEGAQLNGTVYLQRYQSADPDKDKAKEQNRVQMWSLFQTCIHEYLHTTAHADYQAWAQTFLTKGDATRYNTLIEGFCDFFTLNVRSQVTLDPALAKTVEGPYANGNAPAATKSGVYPSNKQAEQVVGIVGIKNAQAAYFGGKTKLMGE